VWRGIFARKNEGEPYLDLMMRCRGRRFVQKLAFAALLTVLLPGCTTFNQEWNQAARLATPADDLAGRWQGVWKSDATGHADKLRCVVTKQDEGAYRARFFAKYHTVMSFGYTVPLQVERADGAFEFSGEANLGWIAGGMYYYDGHADATNFFATYTNKYDHGTFQMGRP
jgi:hypothetical protein